MRPYYALLACAFVAGWCIAEYQLNTRTVPPIILEAVQGKQFETFTAKVTGIVDGDTIKVRRIHPIAAKGRWVTTGDELRVRLWGIDAPENGQPFSARAKQFTSEHVFGRVVTV